MGLSTHDGDIVFRNGQATFAGTIKLPGSCVGSGQIDPSNPLPASVMQHQHEMTYRQSNGSAVVSDRQAVHVGYGATGLVVAIQAGCVTPNVGADTISVDIKKNNVSILSSAISLTSSQAAYATVAGSIATSAYVTGDVFEVVVTPNHSSGTLGQGVFVRLVVREDAA